MNKSKTSLMTIFLMISILHSKILVMDVEDLRKLSSDGGSGLRELFGAYSVPTDPKQGICLDSKGKEWKGTVDMDTQSCFFRLCGLSDGTRNYERVKCTGVILLED